MAAARNSTPRGHALIAHITPAPKPKIVQNTATARTWLSALVTMGDHGRLIGGDQLLQRWVGLVELIHLLDQQGRLLSLSGLLGGGDRRVGTVDTGLRGG